MKKWLDAAKILFLNVWDLHPFVNILTKFEDLQNHSEKTTNVLFLYKLNTIIQRLGWLYETGLQLPEAVASHLST